jgi:protein-tyrosine-phosphatase/DNA-binding MarR family transcriptional regulator
MVQLTTRERSAIHAALGDEHRLAIVDLLVASDRAPSELARTLGIESNLLAHHLDILEQAGIVTRTRSQGDRRRRYLRLNRDLLDAAAMSRPLHAGALLFVCTGNSARSQFAAALWNQASEATAGSAGTHPAKRIHPQAVAIARRHGFDLSRAQPRPLDEVTTAPDLVVTVCDRAYEELGRIEAPILHWSIPDPAETGTPSAFEAAFKAIQERVAGLAPLVATAS